MISVRLADRLDDVSKKKKINGMIFSDNINVKNVQIYGMVLLIKLYPLIALLVTMGIFQGHGSVKSF